MGNEAASLVLSISGNMMRSPLTAWDMPHGTHLWGHQAAVSAPIHVPAGKRQLQAGALVSQAAAEVSDHQPGAAIWEGTGRGEGLIFSESPS